MENITTKSSTHLSRGWFKMVIAEYVARSSIIIGIIELVVGAIAIICGSVSVSKMSGPFFVTIGLWSFYFAIPGILCIVTGFKKQFSMMGITLAANIVGIVLAAVALLFGSIFWAALDYDVCNYCTCNDNSYDSSRYESTYGGKAYSGNCSDVYAVRDATAVVTIVYAIQAIVCFVGSIYGCVGTCCSPRAPTVVIVGGVPIQGNTIMFTSQTANLGQPMAYDQPMAQGGSMAYGQPMVYLSTSQQQHAEEQHIAKSNPGKQCLVANN